MVDLRRRSVLAASAVLSANCAFPAFAQVCASIAPRPDPSNFESGDLLWPKDPGALVPFAAATDVAGEELLWATQRDAFVSHSRSPNADDRSRQLAERIQLMTYAEYLEAFATVDRAETLDGLRPYGNASIGGGHVGIVERNQYGNISVIDAMPKGGVAKTTYAEWLRIRPCYDVWHGRIASRSAQERAKVVEAALQFVGTKYDFFNFTLDDPSGFYCSKLVWLSVYSALNIALDSNTNTQRWIWVSPLRLLRSTSISVLHNPGDYTGTR